VALEKTFEKMEDNPRALNSGRPTKENTPSRDEDRARPFLQKDAMISLSQK
jgi:hypothetical protein